MVYSDLLLLAEHDGIALPVLYCAAKTGARIHLLTGPKAAYLRHSRLIASCQQITLPEDGEDLASLRQSIEAFLRQTGSGMLLPGDEYATRMAVQLAPWLSVPVFPCPDVQTYRIFNNKWDFHGLCKSLGVAVPKTAYIGTKDAIRSAQLKAEFGFPLVIKPSNQGNGNGVVILQSEQEIELAISRNPDYHYDTLIAQEYVAGYDIDCSTLSVDGEVTAVAVQRRVNNAIVFTTNSAFVDDVKRILAATRYTGVAHFDARLCARTGAARIIECNPRFWASINAAQCCGLNFVELGLQAGARIRHPPRVLDEGRFLPWGVMAQQMLGLNFSAITSVPTLRGVWSSLTDPIPTFLEALHRRVSRNKV